jgi:hypothetical protein
MEEEIINIKITKTLFRKYSSEADVIAEIEMMNNLLGYPDGNGTDRYAEVPIPFVTYEITTEEGTTRITKPATEESEGIEIERYWLLECTHNLQDNGNPDIPMVSVEVLGDGSLIVTDGEVHSEGNPDDVIQKLADNAKNCLVELQGSRTSTVDDVVTNLISMGNTVVTQGDSLQNKYAKIFKGDRLVFAKYFESGKIESPHEVEVGDISTGISADGLPPLPKEGEWIEKDKLYAFNNQAVHCKQGHNRTHYPIEEIPNLLVLLPLPGVKPPQWVSENYYLYVVGYQVFDTGKVWRAKNTTHTWIQPALEGNGAISWEFVKDWIE